MKYVVQLTKTIVTVVHATSELNATEMALADDESGLDGLWEHATPFIEIIEQREEESE